MFRYCIAITVKALPCQEDFEQAAEDARIVVPDNITEAERTICYGLYKQARDGDINIDKPGFFDVLGKKKWEAWNQYKGMDKETAMKKYIAYVEELKVNYNVAGETA